MTTLKKLMFNVALLLFAISIANTSLANEADTKATNEPISKTASKSINEIKAEEPMTHAEEAHKNHCYKCHTDDVYTRDNRFVKSIDALSKQVVRCKEGSDIPWFDEDADAVVQFLNKKYYRF
ncbi:hypothetical protein MNBD_GAMMA06-916 [hydrothermal vent metagenome]|uniref:Uncharacterized protein n=1 Tax=hydrothermal vent metagenome TaxID=652676 RepID=A0A3B0WQD9_9ZZZZ